MIIDIKKTVLRTQVRRMFTLFGLIVAGALILSFIPKETVILGMHKHQILIVLGCLYVISLVIEAQLELNYIYFRNDTRSIVLRYFSMSVFNRKKNSIEIAKESFRGYEVQISLWGFRKKLVLFEQIKDKIARYHPVSITSLSRQQQEQLLATLDKYK